MSKRWNFTVCTEMTFPSTENRDNSVMHAWNRPHARYLIKELTLNVKNTKYNTNELICDNRSGIDIFQRNRNHHIQCIQCQQFIGECSFRMDQVKKWDATSILSIEQSELPYAIVVLNRPILFEPKEFQQLWNQGNVDSLFNDDFSNKFYLKYYLISWIARCSRWWCKSLV